MHVLAAATLPGPVPLHPRPPIETVLLMESAAPVHLAAGRPLAAAKGVPLAVKRPLPPPSQTVKEGKVADAPRAAVPLPVPSSPAPVPPSPVEAALPGAAKGASARPALALLPALPNPAGDHLPAKPRAMQVESLPAPEQARQRYLKQHFGYIRDLVANGVVYPPVARRMNWSGRTVVAFMVTEEGAVVAIAVLETSGFPVLDKSALEAVRNAAPFPKPPVRAQIVLPVTFRISR
nr:energy transducer TonB [Geomonas sp. Red32]